jgi:multiple sugar transport system permease protein
MIFAPFVLGIAVIGVLFNYLLDTQFGLCNYLLGFVGSVPSAGSRPSRGPGSPGRDDRVVDARVQHHHLSGRAGKHPGDQYEAAELDGPERGEVPLRHRARSAHVLVFVITTTILASANMFGQSYLVTKGGPGDSTRTAIMVMTEQGLQAVQDGDRLGDELLCWRSASESYPSSTSRC